MHLTFHTKAGVVSESGLGSVPSLHCPQRINYGVWLKDVIGKGKHIFSELCGLRSISVPYIAYGELYTALFKKINACTGL